MIPESNEWMLHWSATSGTRREWLSLSNNIPTYSYDIDDMWVCVFCSLLNLCNRLSLFLLSLIQHNWSDRFLHALDVFISSWQHALSLFVSGQPRPQLDQSNPAAFCLAFCVTEHLSLCCNSIHFDNLAPKLSGWFLILHTALLICKHHTKATGEHIIIQRTSSQTDAVEPCDVGLINDMDWRAPAVGYVGQAN